MTISYHDHCCYVHRSAAYLSVILLELLLSLLAFGARLCAGDTLFLMDVVIVCWSVGATWMTGKLKFAISLVRVFRVPGLLERLGLWRKSDMYLAMIETFRISLPRFLKIFWLLFLLVYITAALCVQVFGNVKTNARISRTAKFSDMQVAIQTLMQIIFGDEWHQIMEDCSVRPPFCTPSSDLQPAGGAGAAASARIGDCGASKGVSFLLFFSFKVIAEWVVLNLVMGMLVNSFSFCAAQHDASRAVLAPDFVERLRDVWDAHDRSKRGWIRLETLWTFMKAAPLPLGMGPVDGYVNKFLPVFFLCFILPVITVTVGDNYMTPNPR